MHKLIKRVGIVDGLLVLIILSLLAFVPFKFVAMMVSGLIIAYLNFAANSIITYYTMASKDQGNGMYTFIGFIIRVAVVAAVGVIAFTYNKYFVIAYLLGYSLHFISLILYGVNAK